MKKNNKKNICCYQVKTTGVKNTAETLEDFIFYPQVPKYPESATHSPSSCRCGRSSVTALVFCSDVTAAI